MVAELLMPALKAVAVFLGNLNLIENVFGELIGDKAEALIEAYKTKKWKNKLQSVIVSEIEDFSKHHKKTAARFFDKICEIQWDKDVLQISPSEGWSDETPDQVAKAVANSLVPIPVELLCYQFQRNIDHFADLHGYNKLIRDFITKLLRIQNARAQYYQQQLSAKEKAGVGLTAEMIAKLIAPMHVEIRQFSDAICDAKELFVCMIKPSALAASSMMKYWESKINPKVESEVRNYLTWVNTQYLTCTEFVKSPYLTELERKEQQKELVYWERVALSSSRWGKYIIPTGGKFNLPKADSTAAEEKKAPPKKLPSKALISPTPKPAAPSSAHLELARSSGQEVVTLQTPPTTSPNSSSRFSQEPQKDKPQKDKPQKELASRFYIGQKITVTVCAHDKNGLSGNSGNYPVCIPRGEIEEGSLPSPSQLTAYKGKTLEVEVIGFGCRGEIIIASRKALLQGEKPEIISEICFIKKGKKGRTNITYNDIGDNRCFDRIAWVGDGDIGLKRIEQEAFMNCSELTFSTNFSIVQEKQALCIPDSVTYIGTRAFAGCSKLSRVIIPSSVMVMGEEVFKDCSENLSIYCLANKDAPDGWDKYWVDTSKVRVHWGAKIGENYNIIPGDTTRNPKRR